MNILYLLGNGFDKAQDMATSYPEFYADLMNYKPKNPLEIDVLNTIRSDYKNWADLEEALGKYTTKWNESSQFRNVLKFLNVKLKEYLRKENTRASEQSQLSFQKLAADLASPDKYLEEQGSAIYHDFFNHAEHVTVNIVTFNYTDTLERALADIHSGDRITKVGGHLFFLGNILHIHGTLDDMIMVGVNDDSQIAYDQFRIDDDIRDEFIKPEINEGCQNTRNATFTKMINDADIIVLFGVSVGITDNKWWTTIGRKMDTTNSLLLYFPYDPTKNTIGFPNYKRRWSNKYIEFLKERMQIKQEVDYLRNHICIGINKDFLKLVGAPDTQAKKIVV